jgi:hypothetical protein
MNGAGSTGELGIGLLPISFSSASASSAVLFQSFDETSPTERIALVEVQESNNENKKIIPGIEQEILHRDIVVVVH